MPAASYKKEYVTVNVNIDEEGVIHPRFILWNNGVIYPIERVIHKCRASSSKVGGGGIRYTVLVSGRESFLYQEGSKWFVEAKIS